MKKDYITPEVKIKLIDFRDILTDSQQIPPEGPADGGNPVGPDGADPSNFFK